MEAAQLTDIVFFCFARVYIYTRAKQKNRYARDLREIKGIV